MKVPTLLLHNTTGDLDKHRLRTYLFNDYYLRYFTQQLAQATKAAGPAHLN